ncbi:flagellar type III secretion system pore protein FliP [Thiobacter aerophilum]|uniref:Flagellar biosynthetic protein FliP n=1 Tax=Thiobacter aerophilum TaxID=3121275 RepID=A0ABV0EB23_9BURK
MRLAKAILLSGLPLLLSVGEVWAQTGLPAFTSTPAPGGGQTYTLSVQTLILIAALTFIPALLLMTTSFLRIVIVLSLLRQAIGTVQSPPNQVIVGIALFLTFFIMSPVLDRIYVEAYQPYMENRLPFDQALEKASQPLKQFMLAQVRQEDLALFAKLGKVGPMPGPEAVPMKILIPAYVTSELKTAFQIGFLVFIPFLIIDMVVASVLMSMGMMMLSPVLISLPFKLMLFVLVDGWGLLLASLVRSFNP